MDLGIALRLTRLQERVFRCIEDELQRDGHHKSYEGAIDVSFSLPCIFERDSRPEWTVSLHCYVVPVDGRHDSWTGETLAEAVAKAEAAIDKLCHPYEMARFERSMECVDEPGEMDGSSTIFGATRAEIPE